DRRARSRRGHPCRRSRAHLPAQRPRAGRARRRPGPGPVAGEIAGRGARRRRDRAEPPGPRLDVQGGAAPDDAQPTADAGPRRPPPERVALTLPRLRRRLTDTGTGDSHLAAEQEFPWRSKATPRSRTSSSSWETTSGGSTSAPTTRASWPAARRTWIGWRPR